MEYSLNNYSEDTSAVLTRLSKNSKARRLEAGYSRKTLAALSGVPAPTIERFERTGKISLEAFCKIAIVFDFYDELAALLDHTKYSTSEELERINRNLNRKNGR